MNIHDTCKGQPGRLMNMLRSMFYLLTPWWGNATFVLAFNPFVPDAPALYPLKASENLKVFWRFQGLEKGCTANKWVNISIKVYLRGKCIWIYRKSVALIRLKRFREFFFPFITFFIKLLKKKIGIFLNSNQIEYRNVFKTPLAKSSIIDFEKVLHTPLQFVPSKLLNAMLFCMLPEK